MASWLPLFWDRLLTIYGQRIPYHPGKWRMVFMLENKARESWTRPRIFECRGTKYEVDLRHKVERRMFYLNWHDRSETRLLERMIRPGWVAFDVGANFGYYTLLFARLVGPTGCVYSFEPASANYERLRRNIALNNVSNVRAYRVALGDRCGEASLIAHSTGNPAEIRVGRTDEQGSETTALTTLDQAVEAERLRRLDFIKVDIEGSELRFLAGAKKTLSQFRPMMMIETHPAALGGFGSTIGEFAQSLAENRYAPYRLGWRGVLLPLRELPTTHWTNIIALPR